MTMQLVCRACGATHPEATGRWRCGCGAPLDVDFEGAIDTRRITGRPPGMWRYREALPISADHHVVSFNEGFTPLVQARIDGRPLTVKQENLFPTGSFKDRGASVLISRALELGVEKVVEDSSGNAGAAVAAYAAKAGMACEIFVPESTSPGKLAQIRLYGANLIRVPGSREATARAAMEAADRHFYASHVWNPFFFQGTKTYAFEIWEQLGFYGARCPDRPHRARHPADRRLSWIPGPPEERFDRQATQNDRRAGPPAAPPSTGCGGIDSPGIPHASSGDTLAEGIAIAEPARASQILDIVRETGGEVVSVTDHEIEKALLEICNQGLYAEPTSATAIAAFSKVPASVDECIVAPLTGHGLKSTEKMLKLADG